MYIGSISNELKIHVWPSGQLAHTYKSSAQGCIKSISWSKDGSWLVLVPSKGPAEIISMRDNIKHLYSIQDIQQPTCAAFQNNTKRSIALGTTTGIVLVYDIKSKSIRKHFPRAPSTVFKVEYCAKDAFLAAACENGEALLYNSVTLNLSASYKLPNSKTVSALSCHPNRRNLLGAGSHEGVVGVWDIHANKLIYHNQAHAATVTDLTFSPLRSDLIVTTGFDRKFAFYDMSQKSSLVQAILDKSPTAVDFCSDGIGIAVALHDGTINAYDTRQLNEALYSFKAHNTQIRQVVFQKKISEKSVTDYTFMTESNDSAEETPTPRECGDNNNKQSFDSVGQMFCGDMLPDIPEVPTDLCSDLDAGDSFIDAIGLNSNNATAKSARESIPSMSHGIRRDLGSEPDGSDSFIDAIGLNSNNATGNSARESIPNMSSGKRKMPHMTDNSYHISPMLFSKVDNVVQIPEIQRRISETFLQNKAVSSIKAQEVSTPKFPLEGKCSQIAISPIVSTSCNSNVSNMSVSDLEKLIHNIIKQEVKDELETFHQQVRYEFMDIAAQMRRQFLDLQMSFVKEFVQLESSVSKIKEYSGDNGFGEQCLIQENIKLRKELAALREEAMSNTDE